MDRAVVGICPRLGKRVGELFVGIHHLRLEHTLRAYRRMRDIITVRPNNCRSQGYCNRLRSETEIVNFYVRSRGGGLLIACHDALRSDAQEQ